MWKDKIRAAAIYLGCIAAAGIGTIAIFTTIEIAWGRSTAIIIAVPTIVFLSFIATTDDGKRKNDV